MSESSDIDRLTGRQLEILELVAKGLTNADIGELLGCSPTTVRAHVSAILAVLEVSNRTEATARFLAACARPERVGVVLERPAIAVLPLVALDDDARTNTVARAIARDLTGLFARACWFPVISQISSARARTVATTSQALGAELGARFLVDGALWMTGEMWRLDLQIDDTTSGHCLWTERFELPAERIFDVLGEICARVVAQAYPVLVQQVQAGLASRPVAADLSAWEIAHQAMDLCAVRALDANQRATELFARASARDPTLVLAHYGAGLAAYDAVLNQWADEGEAARDRLAAAADHCLALAPHMGEGYFLQARYFQACGEHGRVVPALEAAIGRNPSFAQAHALLAQALHVSGRSEEGMARMRHALRLGPRAFGAGLAMLHFMRCEYREALVAAEQAVTENPRYSFARVMAAVSAREAGEDARAAEHVRRLRKDYPPFVPGGFSRQFGPGTEGVRRITATLEALGMTSAGRIG